MSQVSTSPISPVSPVAIVGPVPLKLVSMTGSEGLGRCFEYFLDVLSANPNLKASDLVEKTVTVSVPAATSTRYFNGVVASIEYRGAEDQHLSRYRLVLRPWLWFLTRAQDCRIFQNTTTLDILKKVFSAYPLLTDFTHLRKTYSFPREYVVQYRETDFHFVTRLLEAEGIYYYFVHENGKHTMVLTDQPTIPEPEGGWESVPFATANDSLLTGCISEWSMINEVQPTFVYQRDFDFTKANVPLFGFSSQAASEELSNFDVYEYPGGFSISDEGNALATLRLDQLQVRFEQVAGAGNAHAIVVGKGFKLTRHPRDDQNKSYLVMSASYRIHGQREASGGAGDSPFACIFTALDLKRAFRVTPTVAKPVMRGPQTAIVVGREAKEIDADKFGRVKVRFHWDRDDPGADPDAQNGIMPDGALNSCYVRVAQVWAGAGWGAVFTPRVGQEVMVDFLEGDPDRPIIVGRLHNSMNMPPYAPAAHPTTSGIRTHSAPGGNPTMYNEIRFEDLKGQEDLFIQAQNTQTTLVKGSQSIAVGGKRALTVAQDDSTKIGTEDANADQSIDVEGNRTVIVALDHLTVALDKGSITLSHKSADIKIAQDETITVKNAQVTVTLTPDGDITIKNPAGQIEMLHAGALTINNDKPLTIRQVDNSIEFTDGKIVVHAKDKVEINATEVKLTAGEGTSSVDLTSSGATVTAPTINLNS